MSVEHNGLQHTMVLMMKMAIYKQYLNQVQYIIILKIMTAVMTVAKDAAVIAIVTATVIAFKTIFVVPSVSVLSNAYYFLYSF